MKKRFELRLTTELGEALETLAKEAGFARKADYVRYVLFVASG